MVLADSYYCCGQVREAAKERVFRFISPAKRNRRLDLRRRVHRPRIDHYGANVLRRRGRTIQLGRGPKARRYRIATAERFLEKIGRVFVTFSRRRRGGGFLSLVSNDPALTGPGGGGRLREPMTDRNADQGREAEFGMEPLPDAHTPGHCSAHAYMRHGSSPADPPGPRGAWRKSEKEKDRASPSRIGPASRRSSPPSLASGRPGAGETEASRNHASKIGGTDVATGRVMPIV